MTINMHALKKVTIIGILISKKRNIGHCVRVILEHIPFPENWFFKEWGERESYVIDNEMQSHIFMLEDNFYVNLSLGL